ARSFLLAKILSEVAARRSRIFSAITRSAGSSEARGSTGTACSVTAAGAAASGGGENCSAGGGAAGAGGAASSAGGAGRGGGGRPAPQARRAPGLRCARQVKLPEAKRSWARVPFYWDPAPGRPSGRQGSGPGPCPPGYDNEGHA